MCERTARTVRWGAGGDQRQSASAARHQAPPAYPTQPLKATERGYALRVTVLRLAIALLVIGIGMGAFFAGRRSVQRTGAPTTRGGFAAGYLAGREDAFSGFDGGWTYATPYIVTLRRGGPGITYRFARRWPMHPGIEYRACRRIVCSRTAR